MTEGVGINESPLLSTERYIGVQKVVLELKFVSH